MSFSSAADIYAAFNEEAGDAASLAIDAEKLRWWNEGQGRLGRYVRTKATITWNAADLFINLPSDFVQLDRLDYAAASVRQDWRQFGKQLIIDDPVGASNAGSATLYYLADRPDVTGAVNSTGTQQENYACLYYALHRFYRKLASSRLLFNRYATLVGANGVSISDIQAESDRLLQDFVDARAELPPPPPATYYRPRG